ncbi:hypothetical protein [Paraburkholderia bannensis]|uniref:hypothetical protein n=1 Tax=Paraburkholderia bannensis TaxID=765414 RepID=UPI0038CD2DE3
MDGAQDVLSQTLVDLALGIARKVVGEHALHDKATLMSAAHCFWHTAFGSCRFIAAFSAPEQKKINPAPANATLTNIMRLCFLGSGFPSSIICRRRYSAIHPDNMAASPHTSPITKSRSDCRIWQLSIAP